MLPEQSRHNYLNEQASAQSVNLLKHKIRDLVFAGRRHNIDNNYINTVYKSEDSVYEVAYKPYFVGPDEFDQFYEEFTITKKRIADLTSIGYKKDDEAYSYTITLINSLKESEDVDVAYVDTHTYKHPKIALEPSLSQINDEIFNFMMYLKTPKIQYDKGNPESLTFAFEHIKRIAHEGLVRNLLNELENVISV